MLDLLPILNPILNNRLYPSIIPTKTPTDSPLGIYQEISQTDKTCLINGQPIQTTHRYQLTLYTPKHKQSQQIGIAIKEALYPLAFELQIRDGYEHEAQLFKLTIDFKIRK